jgi:hypothetical protein
LLLLLQVQMHSFRYTNWACAVNLFNVWIFCILGYIGIAHAHFVLFLRCYNSFLLVFESPGQVSFVSQYAMIWSMKFCGSPFVVPRSSTSKGVSNIDACNTLWNHVALLLNIWHCGISVVIQNTWSPLTTGVPDGYIYTQGTSALHRLKLERVKTVLLLF